MTRPTEPLLPPIDDEAGPMPPLSAAEADAIAWAAVSCWAAQPPGLEPVDGALGPSKPLSAESAERLVQGALRLHTQRQQPKRAIVTWMQRAAAVALCLLGAAGVAFAAYRLWPAHAETRSQTTAPSRDRTTPNIAPLEVPDAQPDTTITKTERPADSVAPPPRPADFDAVLARANALRAKRRWATAEATYRQVVGTQASTAQRYVALVAAAAIAQEHLQKPARALALYESALTLMPQGNLSQDAQFGIASCQRALGDPLAEQRALERLTREYPSGIYSSAAARRLAELAEQTSPK